MFRPSVEIAFAVPNAYGAGVTNPRSRPAFTTDLLMASTLAASKLQYSSSSTDARNMKFRLVGLLDELSNGANVAAYYHAWIDVAALGPGRLR
jgi:hypothetical protein